MIKHLHFPLQPTNINDFFFPDPKWFNGILTKPKVSIAAPSGLLWWK